MIDTHVANDNGGAFLIHQVIDCIGAEQHRQIGAGIL